MFTHIKGYHPYQSISCGWFSCQSQVRHKLWWFAMTSHAISGSVTQLGSFQLLHRVCLWWVVWTRYAAQVSSRFYSYATGMIHWNDSCMFSPGNVSHNETPGLAGFQAKNTTPVRAAAVKKQKDEKMECGPGVQRMMRWLEPSIGIFYLSHCTHSRMSCSSTWSLKGGNKRSLWTSIDWYCSQKRETGSQLVNQCELKHLKWKRPKGAGAVYLLSVQVPSQPRISRMDKNGMNFQHSWRWCEFPAHKKLLHHMVIFSWMP